jgi:hypothetical protein
VREAEAEMTARFALAVLLASACGRAAAPRHVPPDEAKTLLLDRNWIDVWPESDAQPLHVYRFVPSMGGGVYQDRTLYAGRFELFAFETDGTTIRFDLPHAKQRAETRFAIERVDGPEPFDLRLTLASPPRGPAVYYGRSAETLAEALRLR